VAKNSVSSATDRYRGRTIARAVGRYQPKADDPLQLPGE